ncbi:Hypothetical protein CINCED_3A007704 [Cinara cedri]|uniref:Centrosomal protein n=1 Tax=Cinara cedri TaxID=506608 RepID=A0A5E4MFQ7_9HEMI|nr:Hypothetical protein CINCED_3A007704 [Cinara cedri]
MSDLDTGPKAASTALKPMASIQRSLENSLNNVNNTFNSVFSEELTSRDLLRKSLSIHKNSIQMDSMHSSLSGQSSLGILELDNMSDIGNTYKRETFPNNNNQSILQHRLSQATQTKNTLARASAIKSIFDKNVVGDTNVRASLINITNAFHDMLKDNINNSNSTFSSDDFIPGSEFKENLIEIEEAHRKEFGSLSESRFNFTLEEEKQPIENGSFNYFAAKSVPVEDLSTIFPKKQKNNETFTKRVKEINCSLLDPNNTQQNKDVPTGYQTMSSITSWTDSNVSNNLLNLTSLSDISEVLSTKTNSSTTKELTESLLTKTFPSIQSFRSISSQKKILNMDETHLQQNKSINPKQKVKSLKREHCLNNQFQYTRNNNNLSNHFDKKQTKLHVNSVGNFILTPRSGYFEDCKSEINILENNIDLSSFSILSNNPDCFTEMSLNKSANVSKIVYCNEALCQDKLIRPLVQDNRKTCDVLEIGDICIGAYSQAVITLENQLTVDAKYSLILLDVSLDNTKNNAFVENKPTGTNIATVLCSDKVQIIPSLSEASFTIGIIPLISGSISVYIKLKSNDLSQEIFRNIQIHSIEPQVVWVNNSFGSINFGLLPELSKKSLPIKLLNKGAFQVPIKLILNQDQCEDIIQAKGIINPSELWQCDINILTPSFTTNKCKTKLITGRLQIVLDSVEELSQNYSPLLYCSNLSGSVGCTSISFDQNPLMLKKTGHSTLNGILEISNNSELLVNLSVQQNNKPSPEFTIQPDRFQLAVNEKIKIKIGCLTSKAYSFKDSSICVQVVSSQKQFFIKVKYIESNVEFQPTGSPTSRPQSPWSTSSSSAVGQLELESTCSSLIWGCVTSNTKSVQTFTLRNRGSHKEKLLLSIKDNKNCFKLISPGENQVSEMKLLLESMESQKLSIALISTSNEGEAYGQLILQRQHSSEKRVISLFGYCGRSNVIIHGAFEDNFGNKWLYPNPQFMTAQFTVTNSGNTTAFIKIDQDNSLEDIIQPNEFILKKGETTTVEVSIVMSPERLEMLVEQDSSSKNININKISLIYGDEVSRVRVSRLWNKIKNEKKSVYPDQQRLDEISNMFNGVNFVNVNCLEDSEKSLCKLWKMGIHEDKIIILMEKSNLESLLCDTTMVFSELDTTVIDTFSDLH